MKVIIINSLGKEFLEKCKSSFNETVDLPYKIQVVLEEGSREETLNKILKENQGDSLLIVSDDIIFIEGWYDSLEKHYNEADIFGWPMLYPDSKLIQDIGYDISEVDSKVILLPKDRGEKQKEIEPRVCDSVCGCALFIKRHVVGRLIEFPLDGQNRWGEFLFLQLAKKQGFKTMVLDSFLFHHGKGTKTNPDMEDLWTKIVDKYNLKSQVKLTESTTLGNSFENIKGSVIVYGIGTVSEKIKEKYPNWNYCTGIREEQGTKFNKKITPYISEVDFSEYDNVIISPLEVHIDILRILKNQLSEENVFYCEKHKNKIEVKKVKKLLLLGAGEEQIHAIKMAQHLGYRVIAVDGNVNADGFEIADIGIHADIRDSEEMIKLGKEHKVDGVFCHAVEIPHVVAKVAAALKVPGLSPEVAQNATNKLKRITILKKAGVPVADFRKVTNTKEAEKAAEEIGFPVVVKPLNRSGARGVTLVKTKEEINQAIIEATEFTDLPEFLVEEYMIGPELSTESVIYKGKVYTPCWADRNYSKKELYYPYMIEDGGELPTKFDKKMQEKIEATIKKTINALGITMGAAKGDILIKNNIPHVIEMAVRTSGGRFCDTKVPLSNGVNILKPLIQMHMGDSVDLDILEPKFQKGCSERTIFPKPGKIISIEGIEEVKAMPNVWKLHLNNDVKVGKTIEPLRNHACKVGYVITVADTREEAMKDCEEAISKINIITK